MQHAAQNSGRSPPGSQPPRAIRPPGTVRGDAMDRGLPHRHTQRVPLAAQGQLNIRRWSMWWSIYWSRLRVTSGVLPQRPISLYVWWWNTLCYRV